VVELEAKTKELERFNYTISHDLKSPLITIKGFLGYIEQDFQAGNLERVNEDLTRISEAANKMQAMLDELLEVARIGHVVHAPETISLGDLAKETIEFLSSRLHERDIQIDISPYLPTVYGDPFRLRELMENLIDNAAKFMGDEPSPQINIGSYNETDEQVIYIRDNGIGIEPQHQKRVFELFDQLDPHIEGSGLGLAIARRIVETHGGRIWVESEGLGKGTTFYFCLPVQETAKEESSVP
jgi:signal transduction histidine kinase